MAFLDVIDAGCNECGWTGRPLIFDGSRRCYECGAINLSPVTQNLLTQIEEAEYAYQEDYGRKPNLLLVRPSTYRELERIAKLLYADGPVDAVTKVHDMTVHQVVLLEVSFKVCHA